MVVIELTLSLIPLPTLISWLMRLYCSGSGGKGPECLDYKWLLMLIMASLLSCSSHLYRSKEDIR